MPMSSRACTLYSHIGGSLYKYIFIRAPQCCLVAQPVRMAEKTGEGTSERT